MRLQSKMTAGATLSYDGHSSAQGNPLSVGYDSTNQSVYFNLGLWWAAGGTANTVYNPVEVELLTPSGNPVWQSVTPGASATVQNFVYLPKPLSSGSATVLVYNRHTSMTAQYGSVINGLQIVW